MKNLTNSEIWYRQMSLVNLIRTAYMGYLFMFTSKVSRVVNNFLFAVQHVLIKPEVKGLDNEVAGPPPSEPK